MKKNVIEAADVNQLATLHLAKQFTYIDNFDDSHLCSHFWSIHLSSKVANR